jgi:hypothetical protein
MAKILRAKSVASPKTPKKTGTNGQDAISKSWHDPSVLVGKTTKKSKTRILMQRDPINKPLTRPEVDQFTNNPNPKYDPSKGPGSVAVKKMPKGKTGTGRTGHGKVIPPNNQTRNGGKTLRTY